MGVEGRERSGFAVPAIPQKTQSEGKGTGSRPGGFPSPSGPKHPQRAAILEGGGRPVGQCAESRGSAPSSCPD